MEGEGRTFGRSTREAHPPWSPGRARRLCAQGTPEGQGRAPPSPGRSLLWAEGPHTNAVAAAWLRRREAWGLRAESCSTPRRGPALHLDVDGQPARQAGGDWQRPRGSRGPRQGTRPTSEQIRGNLGSLDPPEAGSSAHDPRRSREPCPFPSSILDAMRTNPKVC